MTEKFYLDTAIWRDYFEDRKDNLKPLGEFAFNFLRQCKERKIMIIVSDAVVFELRKYFSQERINEIFSYFKDIIVNVYATPEQVFEANKEWLERKKKLPFDDVLHAVIAKHHAAILVARDNHFFEFLCSIIEVAKPEDITLD